MKVALEGSSLFFKKYTGIPFYIHRLFNAMNGLEGVEPTLAFRLKKRFGSHTDLHKQVLRNRHIWHLGNIAIPPYKYDVCHSLHTPFLQLRNELKVATVHDLAVHLPQFKDYNFASEYFKNKRMALFKEFAQKADVIITVSESTKQDFLSFFKFPEERIHTVRLAPSFDMLQEHQNPSEILKTLNLNPKGYFISMGGISLRKNTFNLIQAYHLSKTKNEFKLVITGKIESAHKEKVMNYVTQNNLSGHIIFTRYVSDQDLKMLYKNAKAFLFPTFYEGFGIPILEAMAAELPVLTSTTGAAPETAGGHAELVDPFEPESIAAGIDNLKHFDTNSIQAAKSFALQHTWTKTAQRTISVYKKYM